MKRLAVARLWFCSNSFSPRRTRAEDVYAKEWIAGPDAFAHSTEPDGALNGVRRFVAAHLHWEATVLRCAAAAPGGPLTADFLGAWMAEVEHGLKHGLFDAVYLSLHGACQAEGDPAADITILRNVRKIMGHRPVVASFDMRANLSEETALLLDGASAVQAWPEGGAADAAYRALMLLEGTVAGRFRPVGAMARVPLVLPDQLLPEAMLDLWRGPLRSLPANVLEADVFGGFCWGDSPYAGPSVLVWTDRDAGLARETAAELARALSCWRPRPVPECILSGMALKQALSGVEKVLVLETSDDPATGGMADAPDLLRALLEMASAGTLGGRTLFAALEDPGIVAAAKAVGDGGVVEATLGARNTQLYGPGVAVSATVTQVAASEGAASHAVLRVGQADILVMATRPGIITPGLLTACGVLPAAYTILAIKGGDTTRQAFCDHGATVITHDGRGPTTPVLARLPYRFVPPALRGAAGGAVPLMESRG